MSRRRGNPFKPTAGMNPPELIGRDSILDDFADALDNGPGAPERLMRVSGVRGVGKTVLLNAMGSIARDHGFTVVDVASNKGFCDRILAELTRGPELSSVTVSPSVLGVQAGSVQLAKSPLSLGEAMLRASRRGGLFVTLDEIQDAPIDELRELGNEIQLLIRQEANVAFAFAGLPAAIDDAVGADALTFLQRAKHVELARLANYEVGASLVDTVEGAGVGLSEGAVALMTAAAAGYPFMVQLVGYYTWQAAARRDASVIEPGDAEKGIATARASFDSMVIAPALRRLPERQREYLLAMALCERQPAPTAEVSRIMGLTTKDTSSYRRRLMDAALVESAGYGKVSFAIPYMREYLLAHEEDMR